METTLELQIGKFTEAKIKIWDQYVMDSKEGTFFHLSGWKKVLEKTFGYRGCYFYAESDGKICGVLPLFVMKNLKFKKIVSSIPFGVYGGVCGDDQVIRERLQKQAEQLTQTKEAE